MENIVGSVGLVIIIVVVVVVYVLNTWRNHGFRSEQVQYFQYLIRLRFV